MTGRRRYLGALAGLVAVVVIYGAPPPPARPRPPSSARGPVTVSMAPTASEAIAHAERLDLAPEQRQRLETLAAEWRRDAVPLEAEAREAMAAFGRFVEEARAAGRTGLDEIGRRSEEVQQRSLALRALRELHAARVLATLDEGQRARLHEGRGKITGGLR